MREVSFRGVVMCVGACVSWFSKTIKCVTLSTSEEEYVAVADVIKEVLFLTLVWHFKFPDVAYGSHTGVRG